MKAIKVLVPVLLSLALTSVLLAAPAQLPSTLIGQQKLTDVQQVYPITFATSPTVYQPGGAFTAYIGNQLFQTTLWCVDAQELVFDGDTYNAWIEPLNGANMTNGNLVRFANVTTLGGTDGWTYFIGPGYNTALIRYELAAFLITQYEFNPTTLVDDQHNQAIQRAIWDIMANNTAPAPDPRDQLGTGDIGTGVPPGYSDWIGYAEAQIAAHPLDLSAWAVVSGGLFNGSLDTFHAKQTYLVQIEPVPEPTFYALLALGVAGVLIRRERSKKRDSAQG